MRARESFREDIRGILLARYVHKKDFPCFNTLTSIMICDVDVSDFPMEGMRFGYVVGTFIVAVYGGGSRLWKTYEHEEIPQPHSFATSISAGHVCNDLLMSPY